MKNKTGVGGGCYIRTLVCYLQVFTIIYCDSFMMFLDVTFSNYKACLSANK